MPTFPALGKNHDLKKDILSLLLLLLLVGILFFSLWPVLCTKILSASPDVKEFYLPWKAFCKEAITRNHRLPLWNPYVACGTPFLAQPEVALFYPLQGLFLINNFIPAFNVSVLLHVYLAALGMYILARYWGMKQLASLLSSCCFAFSSVFILHSKEGHLSNISACAWMPALFLAVEFILKKPEYKRGIPLSIILALQILSGHYQYLYYTGLSMMAYLIFWLCQNPRTNGLGWAYKAKAMGVVLVSLSLGFLLAALQLLPTLEFFLNSSRSQEGSFREFNYSLPHLINLIAPDFFGNEVDSFYWGKRFFHEMCYYIGCLPLLLCPLALFRQGKKKPILYLGTMVLAGLFFSLDILPWFKRIIPFFIFFRGHAKFFIVAIFGLSLLAGFGLEAFAQLIRNAAGRKKLLLFLGIALCLYACLINWYYTFDAHQMGLWQKRIEKVEPEYGVKRDFFAQDPLATTAALLKTREALAKTVLLWGLSLCILAAGLLPGVRGNLLGRLALLITVCDLCLFGATCIRPVNLCIPDWDKKIHDLFSSERGLFRIAEETNYIKGLQRIDNGLCTFFKVANMGGSTGPLIIKRFKELLEYDQGYPRDAHNTLVYARSPTPLLDRLNVKYIFVSRAIHDIAPHLREIFAGDSYSLYENIHVYPRASMAYAVKNVPSKQATLQLITQPEFDLRETVVLPEALQKPLAQRLPARQPRVKIVDYRPETVTIEVDTEEDGILFLADTFYPGWMAYVDKKRADLLKADYCFRAVAVDKGRHSIIFAFAPLSFTTGSYISFFAGIALLVIFLHHGRKKEKAGSINGASLG